MFNYYKPEKLGLHLEIPKTDDDLQFIAMLYARENPIGMIPIDSQKCLIEFRKALSSGSYVRLIKFNNEIHGFIAGMQISTMHSSEKTVQQMYYFCRLEGMLAFRAVVLAHEGLIKYAEGLKAKYVMSTCSQLYKNDNLCRILKLQGWSQFGYVALWNTSHHNSPSQTPSREHSQKLKSV
jgi:hypothetical protein